ncbi:ATP-binding protein [Pedobacter psychrodurus]|uniref:ATP-binding protein n=1 Tax=Pedobacter psychrodurus TaxID=2530456 RepID=UPI00292F85BC|nr:ATP-binding protein [Pedobacter psychrodurus]
MAVHYFDPNGVESLRDNGYRDTAMALAELIDNSIQAEANKIEIILIERLSTTQRKEYLIDEILVADNGIGMNKETLETSLRFGGGTRHGASKGLGKFGMGLPNSSASQCKRFEVYSWQNISDIHFNYFDFEEIRTNRSEFLPEVTNAELPKYALDLIKPIYKTGTVVRWLNCDRLIFRRSKKLVPHITWPLGRIFRYFLNNQSVEIKIRVVQYNGQSFSENKALQQNILPVDPLFLMTGTQLKAPYNENPASELWEDGVFLFPDPAGDETNRSLYKKIEDSLKIKISIVKAETKTKDGGTNSENALGKIYKDLPNISIVRAGREIKLDNFGFITDVGDPTNRWWKIEISFEPTFDKLLGLDNTKQNVHSFRKIESIDAMDIFEEDISIKFISALSEFIANQLKSVKKAVDDLGKGTRGSGGLPPTPISPNVPTPAEDPGPFPGDTVLVPSTEGDIEEGETEKDTAKEELKIWLLNRYPEYAKDEAKLKVAIEWFFATQYNQVFVFLQLGVSEFFNFQVIGHRTLIEINTEHDFYHEFIRPIFDQGDTNKIHQLLLLFGALVESEKNLVSYKQYIALFRSTFGLKLSQFMLEWKESR